MNDGQYNSLGKNLEIDFFDVLHQKKIKFFFPAENTKKQSKEEWA